MGPERYRTDPKVALSQPFPRPMVKGHDGKFNVLWDWLIFLRIRVQKAVKPSAAYSEFPGYF